MGQSVVALMYGVREDVETQEALGLTEEGYYFWDDPETPKDKRLPLKDPRRPRSACDGEVLGFAVAVSNGHTRGEGDLGVTTSIAGIWATHAEHIAKAKERWDAFAAWAKSEHGKDLPTPELWLTTDER